MESLAGWASSAAPELRARLAAEGWVHVPDRGVDTGPALASVLTGLGLRPRAYGEGLSRRTEMGDGVYSATIGDPAEPLAFHAELAHTADPPAILAFACALAAEAGGETRIADGLAIPPALGARWGAWSGRSLAYLTARPAQGGPLALGRTWPEVYGTTDRAAVEARLAAESLDWTWGDDGSLRTRRIGPVGRTWADGRPLWYNHLLLWHVSALGPRGERLRLLLGDTALPHQATWADGSPIDAHALAEVHAAFDACARPIRWRRGDLLLLDNRRMFHGRAPFRGERSVLVALCDPA